MFLSFISALLTAVYTVYSEKEQFRDRPLKGLLQTVQVILYFVGGIIVVSILIDRSPGVLLTGLGASAAVNIDMNSVRFCTPEMLAKYRKIQLLANYVEQTEQVIKEYNEEHHIDNSILVNGRRQTNLGVFRAYLNCYLKSHPGVNHNMTCMVRQLQPTDHGIPLELYFFSATTSWIPYEDLQSDVFDHLLAIISEFDLHVFQSPSGEDFRERLN